MSICITLKDRTALLVGKLDELLGMDYDPKLLEICVTDGGDSQELRDALADYAPKFAQCKYAKSERRVLPFVVPFNNPACDINAQICNVASFNMCVRTDAEVRFRRRDSLTEAARVLAQRKAVTFRCFRMKPGYVVREDPSVLENVEPHIAKKSNDGFFCVAFDKRRFIRMGGVEETFALGFAAEDSYWHWYWRQKKRLVYAKKGHEVLHLHHGDVRTAPAKRVWEEYTMPLYRRMKYHCVKPNTGNPFWRRPEMISGVQTWRA
jgi:hypothetical protein